MNLITYALATYGISAVISLLTVAAVIGINKVMSKDDDNQV